MTSLLQFAVKKPLSVIVLAAVAVIFGIYGAAEMDVDLLPNVQSPTVMVTLNAGDRPAEEIEARFGRRVEERLFSVRGLNSVEQVITSGELLATVRLDWSTDTDLALIEINQALASIANDRDVETLTVRRDNPHWRPLMVIGVRSNAETADLVELRRKGIDEFVPRLEKSGGVAEVKLRGGRELQLLIKMNTAKLFAYDLTLDDIISRINNANQDIQIGTLRAEGRILRVLAESKFVSSQDIGNVIIKYLDSPSGSLRILRLNELADISLSDIPLPGLVRIDGAEGLSLQVYKDGGANTIAAAQNVRVAVSALKDAYPNLKFFIIDDTATAVETSVNAVLWAALAGVCLAIAVLMLFLRSFAPTLIVAITIPVSLCVTFVGMRWIGFSFNLVTLGGLIIGVGLLVDNSIVVVENIVRRRSLGDSAVEASFNGVKSVAGAIFSSTLTTCVVFLPVVFIEGLAASLASGLAFTVIISLLVSLLSAVVLVPALSMWLIDDSNNKNRELPHSFADALLNRLLDNAGLVIVGSGVLVVGACLGLSRLGTTILPNPDQAKLEFEVRGPAGQNAESTSRVAAEIERLIRSVTGEQLDTVLTEVGQLDQGYAVSKARIGEQNEARVTARLKDSTSSPTELVDKILAITTKMDQIKIYWNSDGAFVSSILGLDASDLVVLLEGASFESLALATHKLKHKLQALPAVSTAESSLEGAPPQLILEINTIAAAKRGLSLSDITAFVESSLDGIKLNDLSQGDRQTQMRLQLARPAKSLPLSASGHSSSLENLRIKSKGGQVSRLGDFVSITREEGARNLMRFNHHRIAKISLRFSDDATLHESRQEVERLLRTTSFPYGVSARLGGDESARAENLTNFRWLGVLALILVYLVLTASFESLRLPLAVLSVIPASLIGVFAVLLPLGDPLGIMAMLGLVTLVGIAVNDAILFVHAARLLEAEGHPLRESLVLAMRMRLRPIVMTTATTLLALLPVAIGAQAGSLQAPLAWTIIGGILTSTLASLSIVPCVYLRLMDSKRVA